MYNRIYVRKFVQQEHLHLNMKPKHIKQLQAQSRKLQARRVDHDTFVVESISNPVANHVVTVKFERDGTIHTRCTCEWAVNQGIACSHVMAALEHLASMRGRTLSFWLTEEEAKRQKQRVFCLADQRRDDGVWITSRAG